MFNPWKGFCFCVGKTWEREPGAEEQASRRKTVSTGKVDFLDKQKESLGLNYSTSFDVSIPCKRIFCPIVLLNTLSREKFKLKIKYFND